MTIQQAQQVAADYLAAESCAVDVEMQIVTSAGHTMYAIFGRNGLKSVSVTSRV